MSSAAQITANQLNAQHSTGPRTDEGKTRVAGNALRHGLTAKHLVIRDGEYEQFAVLQESLTAELDPQGAVENLVFHEILHAAWNLHRFRRIEAEVSSGAASDFSDPNTSTALDRLGRYQTRNQRACFKAIRELRALQTNRALRARKLDQSDAASVPAAADINELTKQTQSEVTAEALELALKMVDYEAKTMQANAMRNRLSPPALPQAPLSRRLSPEAAALRL